MPVIKRTTEGHYVFDTPLAQVKCPSCGQQLSESNKGVSYPLHRKSVLLKTVSCEKCRDVKMKLSE